MQKLLDFTAIQKKLIENALNDEISKKTSNTNFGLDIISHPNMEYSEDEIEEIWEEFFPKRKLTKSSPHILLPKIKKTDLKKKGIKK